MKKRLIIPFILLFFIAACSPPAQKPMGPKESSIFGTAEVENCRVTADNTDVKSGAGENFNNIATLNKGQVLDVLGESGNWYVVQLDDNKVGAVDSSDVTPVVKEDSNQPSQQPGQPQQPPQTQEPPQQAQQAQDPSQGEAPQQPSQNNAATGENRVTALTSQEQQMVDLVNSERRKNDLPALEVDLEVTRVARIKSQDMVDNDYFSHNSPTYGSPFDMMKSFGIKYLHAGENLAGNSGVDKAHTALMNSSGHRQNILSVNFTHIGIGIKPSDQYGYLYTQMFISKPK